MKEECWLIRFDNKKIRSNKAFLDLLVRLDCWGVQGEQGISRVDMQVSAGQVLVYGTYESVARLRRSPLIFRTELQEGAFYKVIAVIHHEDWQTIWLNLIARFEEFCIMDDISQIEIIDKAEYGVAFLLICNYEMAENLRKCCGGFLECPEISLIS